MADKSTGKSQKRKIVTVRERTEQTNNAAPKSRKVARTAKAISTPFRILGRGLRKVLYPLRFLLRPFKTRPMRFIGRILSKVLLFSYFAGAWKELRLVTWPGRRETRQLTFAVFVFAFVFGLIITIVDFGLDKIFKRIILQ